ncbi:helix-turn-helix domain-containing protein [Cohnella sp. AR92]|uniref:helix-turn-helix domain-containing protein n=1 Tax=Cohnella sp. AR92 TaxID=648716 RepID=UPI00131565B6|nr:helix-turn-helix domain-containing protein [Cohnella sp. AR92]
MAETSKEGYIRDKVVTHLRKTARRMVQFDTLEETLVYLIDSFSNQFGCDYMAILTIENQSLNPRTFRGAMLPLEQRYPIAIKECLPGILTEPLCSFDHIPEKQSCAFLSALDSGLLQTWFTIPIHHEDGSSLGLCVIGFRSFVPLLLDAGHLFQEYGKDIATAFELARQKESENKKIKGLEWLRENSFLGGSSLEQITEKIVERAGKGTNAQAAYIYLYDEPANCLVLQPPVYGRTTNVPRIDFRESYDLNPYFSYLEKPGGNEITIPLIVNLKLIGILHVVEKESGAFTAEDLELLQFLASHVSVLIENARLYISERERKFRLETFMNQQRELVKHTVEEDGFGSISVFLSDMVGSSVFLFDRFLHLISHHVLERHSELPHALLLAVDNEKKNLLKSSQAESWIKVDDRHEIGLWRVTGGGDSLGYLGLVIARDRLDIVLQMTLNHALNVYAIQFIKQKLVLDVREQVKDSFFNQLFVENIEDTSKILEYANLLNWNIRLPHSIGLLSFEISKRDGQTPNLLEEDAQKTWIWGRIRDLVSRTEPGIVLTRKDGYFITIVPKDKERPFEPFWKSFYERLNRMIRSELENASIYVGVSQQAEKMEDYYLCYKQAQKTLAILCNRFPDRGYMTFEQLGSYSVLYHLGDPLVAPLFLRTYLQSLLNYGKNRDLYDTLRVYLETNGNIKEAAATLYIHRSSLKYRLEKIREILKLDIDNAEQRFNLMLAYKLHDLYGEEDKI